MQPNLSLPRGQTWSLVAQTAILLGLLAIAGLLLTLRQSQRELDRAEYGEQVEAKANEAVQCDYLLGRMRDDPSEAARQALSLRLVDNLSALRAMLPSADPNVRTVCGKTWARIVREEKAHPEYYLSSSAPMRSMEIKLWAALDHPNNTANPGASPAPSGVTENN